MGLAGAKVLELHLVPTKDLCVAIHVCVCVCILNYTHTYCMVSRKWTFEPLNLYAICSHRGLWCVIANKTITVVLEGEVHVYVRYIWGDLLQLYVESTLITWLGIFNCHLLPHSQKPLHPYTLHNLHVWRYPHRGSLLGAPREMRDCWPTLRMMDGPLAGLASSRASVSTCSNGCSQWGSEHTCIHVCLMLSLPSRRSELWKFWVWD